MCIYTINMTINIFIYLLFFLRILERANYARKSENRDPRDLEGSVTQEGREKIRMKMSFIFSLSA